MPVYNLTQVGLEACIQVLQWLEEGVTTRLTQTVVILLTVITVGNLLLRGAKQALCRHRDAADSASEREVLRVVSILLFLSFPAALMLHIVFMEYVLGRISWFVTYNDPVYLDELRRTVLRDPPSVYTTCLAGLLSSYGYGDASSSMAARILMLFDARGLRYETVALTLSATLASVAALFTLYTCRASGPGKRLRLVLLTATFLGAGSSAYLLQRLGACPLAALRVTLSFCQALILTAATLVLGAVFSAIRGRAGCGPLPVLAVTAAALLPPILALQAPGNTVLHPAECIPGDKQACAQATPLSLHLLAVLASIAASLIMLAILILLPCQENCRQSDEEPIETAKP